MSWQGYRNSKLGNSLVEALDKFITEGKLEPEQADIILQQYDKSTAKFLGKSNVKATLKGDLHTYRSYDEVYTLLVKDCEVILSGGKGRDAQARSSAPPTKVTLKGDMVKLVCQDAKIGQRPT
eukprot:CAMPEP_0197482982 /NCGR_PEP_ID=MMETSP1309-20131121/56650_1 /TAXON_ID=464262 /ORGANISM="Genus nov. species nov., Strain RCC998" /LENGTH=122 /DNA_ID=CAMNT_0043025565 /DNA_START=206 /DNA_END=574 /DNA_ORIENTATION=+